MLGTHPQRRAGRDNTSIIRLDVMRPIPPQCLHPAPPCALAAAGEAGSGTAAKGAIEGPPVGRPSRQPSRARSDLQSQAKGRGQAAAAAEPRRRLAAGHSPTPRPSPEEVEHAARYDAAIARPAILACAPLTPTACARP